MYYTTTKNKKKIEHREIIHRWRSDWAMRLAIAKLKKVYGSTADVKIKELLDGLINDQKCMDNITMVDYSISDGYDVYLEAYAYILEENKKGHWQLFNGEDIIITMMKGKQKSATLAQGTGYKIRNYIYKWGQSDYKSMYIEDFSKSDEDGNESNCYDEVSNLVEVNRLYDIHNFEDYEVTEMVFNVIRANCTDRQKTIVHYRMQGLSVGEIAEKLGVKHNTISGHLEKVQEIIKKHFPEMVRGFKEKREKKAK